MITELIDKLRGQASVLADNSNDSDHVRNLILKSLTNSLLEAADTIQFLSDSQPKPCEDCISRQAAVSVANSFDATQVVRGLEKLPSVQTEQRTGHWIDTGNYFMGAYGNINYVECSCCHEDSLEEGDYCPNCGAKMEEGE